MTKTEDTSFHVIFYLQNVRFPVEPYILSKHTWRNFLNLVEHEFHMVE